MNFANSQISLKLNQKMNSLVRSIQLKNSAIQKHRRSSRNKSEETKICYLDSESKISEGSEIQSNSSEDLFD